MRLNCPICTKTMEKFAVANVGEYHRCFHHGVWLPLGFLKRFSGGSRLLASIQRASVARTKDQPLKCPYCRARLTPISADLPTPTVLDLCPRCRSLWFDVGELERIGGKAELEAEFPHQAGRIEPAPEAPADQPQRLLHMPSEYEPDAAELHPLHLLGLPTEEEVNVGPRPLPAVTLAIIVVSIVMTGALMHDPRQWAQWLFYPQMPFAHKGMNWIVSMFLHAGWWHCLSNMYFLWLAGNDVEDELKPANFAALFFIGGIVGTIGSMKLTPAAPSLGASAGVSAVIAYYGLAFPGHRIHMSLFGSRHDRSILNPGSLVPTSFTFAISSGLFVFLFVAKELLLGYVQYVTKQVGGVDHIGHLGGLLVGLIFYATFPRSQYATRAVQ